MNVQRAAQLARLSELAYAPVEAVRAILPSADVDLLDIDDTQVIFVVWPDLAVAAFRGTQVTENFSWADVKSNILQGQEGWFGAGQKVHGGYAEAAKDALPEVGHFLEQHQSRGLRVYFTGHSLGGVLATLAASVLSPEATYTFGAPRVGNRIFAKNLAGKNVFRIVFGSDVAPSYPSPLWGYRHGGARWQLRRNGTLTRGGGWRDAIHFPVAKGVLDHRVANYVAALAKHSSDRSSSI